MTSWQPSGHRECYALILHVKHVKTTDRSTIT